MRRRVRRSGRVPGRSGQDRASGRREISERLWGGSLEAAHSELTVSRRSAGYRFGVIPEIDIWRVANLMLNRFGDEAVAESAKHAEELAEDGDLAGVAVWLRVLDAIRQLAITTPTGLVH